MTTILNYLKGNIWLIVVGLVVFCVALYFGMQKSSEAEVSGEVTYEFSDARIGDVDVVVSGVGQLQAAQQVDLKAVAAGEAIDITAVHITNNQRVIKGQLLVTLDSRDAARRVRNAELTFQGDLIKDAESREIYDNKTKEDHRQRKLLNIEMEKSRMSVDEAREAFSDYQIRAPFSGIITDLQVSSGDSITRTDKIASVITDENVVVVTLNEVDALNVQEGNIVSLTFDALPNVEQVGKVSRVDTIGIADQGVVGYGVEISLGESEVSLRPGMSVNAEITADSTEDVLIVPNSAVKSSGRETYIEEVVGGEVVRRSVKVGASNTFYTEITDGLDVGDTVITNTVRPQVAQDEQSSGGILGNLRIPGAGRGR